MVIFLKLLLMLYAVGYTAYVSWLFYKVFFEKLNHYNKRRRHARNIANENVSGSILWTLCISLAWPVLWMFEMITFEDR